MVTLHMPLIDGRLRLDSLSELDYPHYRALYADPQVALATGLPVQDNEPAARRWFELALDFSSENGRIYALRAATGDELVGVLRLTDWEPLSRNITLGYALSRPYWGHGLMNETLARVLPWLFKGGLGEPLLRIQAWVMGGNSRSRRLLQRLGFIHEGTLRSLFYHGDKLHDICVYGLLASDKSGSQNLDSNISANLPLS